MTYMDQNTPLLQFLSPFLVLYLERIYCLLTDRVGHWQRVREMGGEERGRKAESLLGNRMGKAGSSADTKQNLIIPYQLWGPQESLAFGTLIYVRIRYRKRETQPCCVKGNLPWPICNTAFLSNGCAVAQGLGETSKHFLRCGRFNTLIPAHHIPVLQGYRQQL